MDDERYCWCGHAEGSHLPRELGGAGGILEAICQDWDDDTDEQTRRWDALNASVPCSHTIPGTCDYCGGSR